MTDSRASSAGPVDPHPSDERLVAYLTSGLTQPERGVVDRHVAACDGCLQTLIMVHQRLRVEANVATPVPAALRDRVAAAAPVAAERRPSERRPTGAPFPIRKRLAAVLRLPVLVPVALAAGVAVVVMTQPLWHAAGPPRELSRGVAMPDNLRVTALEAAVRAEPSTHADTRATLRRGATVKVSEEQGDWYRVVLPDGNSGWVERRAFD